MWHETGHRAEVTCITRSPQRDTFAVGYADGSIRLWSAAAGSVIATFNGHKKSVTALSFDKAGARLASGSQDTDIILWDVIAEAGIFRFVESCFASARIIRTKPLSASVVTETRSLRYNFLKQSRHLPLPLQQARPQDSLSPELKIRS